MLITPLLLRIFFACLHLLLLTLCFFISFQLHRNYTYFSFCRFNGMTWCSHDSQNCVQIFMVHTAQISWFFVAQWWCWRISLCERHASSKYIRFRCKIQFVALLLVKIPKEIEKKRFSVFCYQSHQGDAYILCNYINTSIQPPFLLLFRGKKLFLLGNNFTLWFTRYLFFYLFSSVLRQCKYSSAFKGKNFLFLSCRFAMYLFYIFMKHLKYFTLC